MGYGHVELGSAADNHSADLSHDHYDRSLENFYHGRRKLAHHDDERLGNHEYSIHEQEMENESVCGDVPVEI